MFPTVAKCTKSFKSWLWLGDINMRPVQQTDSWVSPGNQCGCMTRKSDRQDQGRPWEHCSAVDLLCDGKQNQAALLQISGNSLHISLCHQNYGGKDLLMRNCCNCRHYCRNTIKQWQVFFFLPFTVMFCSVNENTSQIF